MAKKTHREEMMPVKSKAMDTPVVRTSAGLRDAIFDEIDAVRAGKSNPTRANAIAKLATGIVETVRMELEVQRHLKSATPAATTSSPLLGMPLSLGAGDE